MPEVGGLASPGRLDALVLDDQQQPVLRAVAAAALPSEPLTGSTTTLWVCPQVAWLLDEAGRLLAEWDPHTLLARYHGTPQPWRLCPRYLMTLTQAWLSDLAHGWHETPAPGRDQMAAAGLLEHLTRGRVEVLSG